MKKKRKTMTVKELIDELKKYPEDKQIIMMCTYDGGCGLAGGSEIQIIEETDRIKLYNDRC